MVKQESLLSQLRSIVGPEGVRPDEELPAFAVDGLTPRAAVAPADYEQVAAVVRHADTQGLALIPWGGGAHMHIGNVPRRYDIALSLSRLHRVVEHEPADLTVTCQAGMQVERLQSHLAAHRQLVPLDPPGADRATLGGVLAANASGSWRHAYGTPRDFTIGLRVVTADGRLTRAGGRVVKNVAGYDLCKLYIGSLGTLGVIVECTFKLAPVPREERVVIAAFAAPSPACAFTAELRRRGLALRAAQLLNPSASAAARLTGDGHCALLLELAGTPHAVERSRREIADLAAGSGADLTDPAGPAAARESALGKAAVGGDWLCKATTLPTLLPSLIDTFEAQGGHPRLVAWPTVGVLYAAWDRLDDAEGTIGRLRSAAAAAGGDVALERCPIDVKRRVDVFGEAPPSFRLMRRLKDKFDPQGTLSPGRQVGRL